MKLYNVFGAKKKKNENKKKKNKNKEVGWWGNIVEENVARCIIETNSNDGLTILSKGFGVYFAFDFGDFGQ